MSIVTLRGDSPSTPLSGKDLKKSRISPSILKYNPENEFFPSRTVNSVHFPIPQEPPLLISRTSPPRAYESPSPIVYSSPPQVSGEFYSTSVELQNSWCFWFDKYPGPGLTVQQYEAALQLFGTFSTVQDFWRYYNNIHSPCLLPPRTSYHLMKKGSRPLWEDPENMSGGSFSFRVPNQLTDTMWLHVLLNVIGEQLSDLLNSEDGDDICGVTISRRKDENVIAIWHKYSDRLKPSFAAELVKIIKKNKAAFGYAPVLTYKVHQSEQNFKADLIPVKPTNHKSSDHSAPFVTK